MKTLIVDDRNSIREFITQLLSNVDGIEIVGEAENVASAIEKINTLKPELILLDIQMPDGTGFEVLEGIDFSNHKVIFVTSHEEFAIKAFKYSAVDYLLKPLQIDQLVEAVNQAESRMSSNSVSNQMKILMNQLSGANELTKSEDDFIAIPMAEKIEFLKINHNISDIRSICLRLNSFQKDLCKYLNLILNLLRF